ncbi:class I SAM-dependent methyltransferase [Sorangium sp. So ce363]|uniref:class I SAM-dependent methyltransferase n=1 Tax=Sorangium sp. So ce363 TaxID=3133304 RepID=UPI003F5F1900
MAETAAPPGDYFSNHRRRERFPWSLYHGALTRPLARAIAARGPRPRVLLVGCGLEGEIPGAPPATELYGCDLDARAIEACRRLYPARAARFAVCPGPYELPTGGGFDGPFDVVLAKEVVEHTLDPSRWARGLSVRLAPGGALLLTTPNYGRLSTLPLLEATVLEWIARRDGFSRKHIHPSKFDERSLAALDVGERMRLVSVRRTLTGWSLLGTWQRAPG